MPEWAQFFIRLGKILYRDCKLGNPTLKIVVTVPTKSVILALLAAAGIGDSIFKNANEGKDYSKIFQDIPIGQSLYYMNNGRRTICTFLGLTYSEEYGEKAIKFRMKDDEVTLREHKWSQIQLSNKKEYKVIRRIKGDGLSSEFLKRIYSKETLERVTLIHGERYFIVGNKKEIEELSELYIFTSNDLKKGQFY